MKTMDHTQFRGHVEKECVQILIIKEYPKQNFSYSTVQFINLRLRHPKSLFFIHFITIKLCVGLSHRISRKCYGNFVGNVTKCEKVEGL